MATRKQYEAITKNIIEALESGTVPWHKPWTAPAGNAFPHNAATGRRYSGLNVFTLWIVAERKGFESQAWLSYKQAQELGGNVKKGEKGQFVQFWQVGKPWETGDVDSKGKPIIKKSFMFRMYTVFNVEQCEGLTLPKRENISNIPEDFDVIEEAEAIASAYIANGGPTVAHNGGDEAYYLPSSHSVHLPKQTQFDGKEEYYSTLFHELAHSTGHQSLLGRFSESSESMHFGSERYSKEELVAEFTNAFLCAEVGITDTTLNNSAAYIQSWLKALKEDYTLALTAASRAQKAANLILAAKNKAEEVAA